MKDKAITYAVYWTSKRWNYDSIIPMEGAYENDNPRFRTEKWLVNLTGTQIAKLPKEVYPQVIISAKDRSDGYPSIEFYDQFRE